MVKIAVVIGSTREGRQSDKVAKWVSINLSPKADVEILDLRDYPMPFINEEISPRYNPSRTTDADTQKWLDKVSEFDGFAFVTPEYNRSMSGVLKNALDVIAHEVDDKPAAIVAHGSTGGAQAVANLRMALPGIGMVSLPQAVFFNGRVGEAFSDDGELSHELRDQPYGPQSALDGAMDQLVWYTEALVAARK